MAFLAWTARGVERSSQSCAKGKDNRIKDKQQGHQNACRGIGGQCLQALAGEVVSEVLFCLVVVQSGRVVCRNVLQRKHGAAKGLSILAQTSQLAPAELV